MKYKVTLNSKTYEIEVERGEAILLDEYNAAAPAAAPVAAPAPVAAAPAAPAAAPAAAPVAAAAGEKVVAPMPGNILDIKVSAGQNVKEGQILLILEAMKMENEIVAPRDGVVAQIAVSKGQTVETDALLIVLG